MLMWLMNMGFAGGGEVVAAASGQAAGLNQSHTRWTVHTRGPVATLLMAVFLGR